MFTRQSISIGNLLLDLKNFRIVPQTSQKGALDAIVGEQGKKLLTLAKDIIDNGVNPFDLPMVIDAEDGNQNYIVVEGNRRLTAIRALMDPELVRGAQIHSGFVRLHKQYADSIPQVLDCCIAPNRKAARIWINRKHASGLEGAGTEAWTSIAKARADAEAGAATPALDVVNFVLSSPALPADTRKHLEGSNFNLTSLERLIITRDVRDAMGLTLTKGRLTSSSRRDWTEHVLGQIVHVISHGKKPDGLPFTERDIDSAAKRKTFVEEIIAASSVKRHPAKEWTVAADPKVGGATSKATAPSPRGTPSTQEQLNLVPKQFKLSLPAGKVNDVFNEIKRLDVNTYRHAVSVLFRVFLELTLEHYIDKKGLQLPKDGKGRIVDKLSVRLEHVVKHAQQNSVLTDKELQPINVARSDKGSLLAPDTLNAYVHSKWMNPDPVQLKIMWANVQLFIERLWS